jgi:hypothetical protein
MPIVKALTRALGWSGFYALCAAVALSILARTPGPQGRWAHNVLLGLDFFANAVMAGDPGESISSRLGKWQTMGGWRGVIADGLCPALSLIMLERDHCRVSIDRSVGARGVLP